MGVLFASYLVAGMCLMVIICYDCIICQYTVREMYTCCYVCGGCVLGLNLKPNNFSVSFLEFHQIHPTVILPPKSYRYQ